MLAAEVKGTGCCPCSSLHPAQFASPRRSHTSFRSSRRSQGGAALERLVGALKVFISVVEEISGVSGLLTVGAQDFAQLGAGEECGAFQLKTFFQTL